MLNLRIGTLCLALGVAFTTSACHNTSCEANRRLDTLLGGGVPVCLGEPFRQVARRALQAQADSTGSIPAVRVRESGAEYSYSPVGGIDLGFFRPFSTVGSGCVRFEPKNEARAALVERTSMRNLGGSWRRVAAPEGVRRWKNGDAMLVENWSTYSSVCVATGGL